MKVVRTALQNASSIVCDSARRGKKKTQDRDIGIAHERWQDHKKRKAKEK